MVFSLRRTFSCPVELALEVLGGKWKTFILAHLKGGPLRYRDLLVHDAMRVVGPATR